MTTHRPWYRKKRLVLPVVFCAFVLLLALIFQNLTRLDPPGDIDAAKINLEKPDTNLTNGVISIRNNYLLKNPQGLWELYLQGDGFERGKAFGELCQPLIYQQEQAFVNQMKHFVPNPFYRRFLKYLLAWFNKDLDKHIPREYLLEMYGISLAHSPDFEEVGNAYGRVLNYHAAHDIGHALRQYMLVGCSSFAVKDSLSDDGQLMVGRNFDFYVGDDFAKNKIVAFCKPDSGIPFMSVTWPGFIGAASGMNMAGLTVTINAASSNPPLSTKTPIAILTCEILQYAHNIAEAVAIAQKRETFVSESILISSAQDKEAVIIEKSPEKTAVFNPVNYPLICTNHYQSDAFSEDKMNRENIETSDSPYRFRRLSELIQSYTPLNPTKTAAILRNKEGVQNQLIGYGNQLAINQLVAHHSVIFKPEELKAWVSSSPYQLGAYVCYDLKQVFQAFSENNIHGSTQTVQDIIPEDNFLHSSEFRGYENSRMLKHYIQYFSTVEKKDWLSDSWIHTYEQSNPHLYITHVLIADYYVNIDQKETALNYYQQALKLPIATVQEKKDIEEKIAKLSR